jgi:hypothetical protein
MRSCGRWTASYNRALSLVLEAVPSWLPTYSTHRARVSSEHLSSRTKTAVTDRVDGFHQSGKGNIFLNMGGKYPNQAFTAFIPASSAAQFSQAQQYEGRIVAVSGKIALYKGKPEIIVNSPSQISAQ